MAEAFEEKNGVNINDSNKGMAFFTDTCSMSYTSGKVELRYLRGIYRWAAW